MVLNIQVALIGIVLVIGSFYLWRQIKNLEERVDMLTAFTPPVNLPHVEEQQQQPAPPAELDTTTERVMEDIFGPTCIVSEIAAPPAPSENPSEAPSTGLSKTQVRKMSADSLREVCRERGLPNDGPRHVLIERVLESMEK